MATIKTDNRKSQVFLPTLKYYTSYIDLPYDLYRLYIHDLQYDTVKVALIPGFSSLLKTVYYGQWHPPWGGISKYFRGRMVHLNNYS